MKISSLGQKGQVMVEYILLTAAIVSIMIPIFKLIAARVTEDCPSESLLCKFESIYTSEGMFGGSYRYFTLRGGKRR